jgi:long-chain acyl-CoA synthetase
VADLVTAAAIESPDTLAVVEAEGRSLTYGRLEEEITRVATGLVAHGVVAGHRVLLASRNRLELVTGYLAVLRAQAVAVPVNPAAPADELAWMIADSGAQLVMTDGAAVSAVREAVASLSPESAPRIVVVEAEPEPGETSYDDLRAEADGVIPPLQDPERPAALLYTSGTSGRPRAAILSHRALIANLEQVAGMEPPLLRADDVVLGVLPLFHVYGLNAVLGGVLRHRGRLVIAERFDLNGTLDLIENEACTVVPAAPAVFAHWLTVPRLRERLSTVRLLVSGSAPLAREVADRMVELTGVPIHQGYGLTEAAPVVTSTLGSASPRNGSLGSALAGVELRVVDAGGRPPEHGDPAQIQIRGANLFSGYWPDGAGGPGPDGWWPTGDVGYLDGAGDLFLVDRLHELVVVSGFNVYPQEVEDAIREVPGVREAAVIGVADPTTGSAVVAYVVARDADPGELVAAVEAHCAARLARFKRPARVEVVASLPRTVTGKVQKGRLRGIERRRGLGLID